MNTLKSLFLTCMLLTLLAWRVIGQSPTVSPETSPAQTASVTPATTVSPSPTMESQIKHKIESKLERSIRNKSNHHFGVTIDGDEDHDYLTKHGEDIPQFVLPIVAIVFLSIFGAPVLIVAVILYFGFSKTRMKHRTIRMLVEKGQPIPPELLAPPAPAVRQRSDMRRGVVLLMIGIGIMLFIGAASEWEGGGWALGLIPALIGVGYLLVWKLDSKKDNPPPLP